jgi:hypothetical protein
MQAILDAHFGKAATAAVGFVKKRGPNPWNAFYQEKCEEIADENEVKNGKSNKL